MKKREMKNSGIEWIGDVPADWGIVPLKRLAKIQTGNTPSKTEDNIYFSTENGYLWIKAENLGTMSSIETTTEYLTEEGIQAGRLFPENTVYVCCIASVGKVGFCTVPASCNQQINALIFHNAYWKYGFYLTVAQEAEYLLNASGNVMKIINSDKQSGLMCPFPPVEEQKRIAEYLDHQCAEIDAVIAKTKATIEEYKKLKQSIITEAVTKGVRGDRPMKISGIEWIGDIPAEWESISSKALFTQRKDKATAGENQLTASQQYGVIYQDEYMELTGTRIVTVEKDFDILKHVEAGDFVISMRSFQGGLEYSEKSGSISSAYVMLIPDLELVYPRFYKWLFKSSVYINALQSTSNLVRDGQAMRYSNFAQVRLYTVPLDEQKEIADYLDRKCAEIDTLIEKKTALLAEMETYKKSVIYEYVTGKKEV